MNLRKSSYFLPKLDFEIVGGLPESLQTVYGSITYLKKIEKRSLLFQSRKCTWSRKS